MYFETKICFVVKAVVIPALCNKRRRKILYILYLLLFLFYVIHSSREVYWTLKIEELSSFIHSGHLVGVYWGQLFSPEDGSGNNTGHAQRRSGAGRPGVRSRKGERQRTWECHVACLQVRRERLFVAGCWKAWERHGAPLANRSWWSSHTPTFYVPPHPS